MQNDKIDFESMKIHKHFNPMFQLCFKVTPQTSYIVKEQQYQIESKINNDNASSSINNAQYQINNRSFQIDSGQQLIVSSQPRYSFILIPKCVYDIDESIFECRSICPIFNHKQQSYILTKGINLWDYYKTNKLSQTYFTQQQIWTFLQQILQALIKLAQQGIYHSHLKQYAIYRVNEYCYQLVYHPEIKSMLQLCSNNQYYWYDFYLSPQQLTINTKTTLKNNASYSSNSNPYVQQSQFVQKNKKHNNTIHKGNKQQINREKNSVFSLGLIVLNMMNLRQFKQYVYDKQHFVINWNIIRNKLQNSGRKYSLKLIQLVQDTLRQIPQQRPTLKHLYHQLIQHVHQSTLINDKFKLKITQLIHNQYKSSSTTTNTTTNNYNYHKLNSSTKQRLKSKSSSQSKQKHKPSSKQKQNIKSSSKEKLNSSSNDKLKSQSKQKSQSHEKLESQMKQKYKSQSNEKYKSTSNQKQSKQKQHTNLLWSQNNSLNKKTQQSPAKNKQTAKSNNNKSAQSQSPQQNRQTIAVHAKKWFYSRQYKSHHNQHKDPPYSIAKNINPSQSITNNNNRNRNTFKQQQKSKLKQEQQEIINFDRGTFGGQNTSSLIVYTNKTNLDKNMNDKNNNKVIYDHNEDNNRRQDHIFIQTQHTYNKQTQHVDNQSSQQQQLPFNKIYVASNHKNTNKQQYLVEYHNKKIEQSKLNNDNHHQQQKQPQFNSQKLHTFTGYTNPRIETINNSLNSLNPLTSEQPNNQPLITANQNIVNSNNLSTKHTHITTIQDIKLKSLSFIQAQHHIQFIKTTINNYLKLITLKLQLCLIPIESLKQSININHPAIYINGNLYYGHFKNGRRNGFGLQIFPENQYYYGHFQDDLFHGQGFYYWNKNQYFLGLFQNGTKTFGTLIGPKLNYCGEFKNSKKMNGIGRCKIKTGQVYTGQWMQGKKHGIGQMIEITNDKFIGNWKNGKKYGYGEYILTDFPQQGFKVKAMWYKNDIVSDAIVEYSNGNQYQGPLHQFEKHGKGMYKFKKGGYFKGTFYKDNPTHGQLLYRNGQKYIGSLRNMKRHGFGQYHYLDGTIKKGNWIDDVRVEKDAFY